MKIPKYQIGETVFVVGEREIKEFTVSSIVSGDKEFFYTDSGYFGSTSDLYRFKCFTEGQVFPTKEALVQSIK